MSEISRVALFGKLNSLAYKAIEAATVFCKLRGNPYVELVHWFHQILQLPDSDLHQIVRQSGIDPARLAKDLTEALDRLPRGSTSITDLSSHVEEAVERGWVYGSLMFGESQVRTGYLVIGILKTPSLRHALTGLSAEFAKLKVEDHMMLVDPVGQVDAVAAAREQVDRRGAERHQLLRVHRALQALVVLAEQHDQFQLLAVASTQGAVQAGELDEQEARRQGEVFLQQAVALERPRHHRQQRVL
ncbi:unnamed protein product, partial [marine sediment metagenome]